MRSAFALRIFSGKIIYKFGIPERLRTLRYSIFTGGLTSENVIFYNLWNLLKFFPSAD
jgi:hypothetical protein